MSKTYPPFLSLPLEYCDRQTAKFFILPVPYDGTVCFEKGTAQGPESILSVSDQMEHFDEETLRPIYKKGIYTLPPVEPADHPAEEMIRIEKAVRNYDLFREGRFPIILGGEHSITAPIVKVAQEHYSDLSVLQFDAHSDLRDTYDHGGGGKYSHACVMRRIMEFGIKPVQVGIRSFDECDTIDCPEQVENFITPVMIEEEFDRSVETILNRLSNRVYITVDMDGFDPSFAPGVGTPEPGGLTWRQVTRIIREVCRTKQVIGADVVETMPLGGEHIMTEYMAVRLVGKFLAYNS